MDLNIVKEDFFSFLFGRSVCFALAFEEGGLDGWVEFLILPFYCPFNWGPHNRRKRVTPLV